MLRIWPVMDKEIYRGPWLRIETLMILGLGVQMTEGEFLGFEEAPKWKQKE